MIKTKSLLIILVLVSSIYFSSAYAQWSIQPPTVNIPPTNAFDKIHTSNGTITSANFSMPLIIKGTGNATVTSNNSTHTLLINVAVASGKNGMNGTNGSNGTTISALTCASNSQLHSLTVSGSTGTLHCASNNSTGITSINSDTTANQILQGTSRNVTVTDSGNTHTWNLGDLVVMINGATQTISKQLTILSLVLSGNANGGGFSFTNLNMVNATKFFQNGIQTIDTLTASTGISITGSGNSRTITNTVTDTNTAQVTNVGTSNGLGLQVSRTNATNNNIRSITCGTGLTCSNNATNFRINDTDSSSGITKIQGVNLTSTGNPIFKNNPNATASNYRSIVCNGLTCSYNSTSVRINSTGLTTVTSQNKILTGGDITTTSTTFVDATNVSITEPNRSGGKAMIHFMISFDGTLSGTNIGFQVVDNGVAQYNTYVTVNIAGGYIQNIDLPYTTTTSGQVVKVQWKTSGGTATMFQSSGNGQSVIESLEIS